MRSTAVHNNPHHFPTPVMVVAFLVYCSVAPCTSATEYRVANAKEIKALREQMRPGDVLVMADGTWKDQRIVLKASGTAESPITLRAETPGQVVLTGESCLKMEGQYLVLSGLCFREGRLPNKALAIHRRDRKQVDAVQCAGDHCRLTEIAFMDFECNNYISLYGAQHRVDHCYFARKPAGGPTLSVDALPDAQPNTIDDNHFGPQPRIKRESDVPAISFGAGRGSDLHCGTLVKRNLFEHCKGADFVVSCSASESLITGNTFLKCTGPLFLAGGLRSRVDGNFFFGSDTKRSSGIAIVGGDHTIVNNYLDGLGGPAFSVYTTRGNSAFPQYNPEYKTHYEYPRNCLIAFNTVVATTGPLVQALKDSEYLTWLLIDYGQGTPEEPEDVSVINNIYYPAKDGNILDGTAGTGWTWMGNMTNLDARSKGVHVVDVMLQRGADGVWRPGTISPARGGARGERQLVTSDVDGQPRSIPCDVGCDQLSQSAPTIWPLTPADVGPLWLEPAARYPVKVSAR